MCTLLSRTSCTRLPESPGETCLQSLALQQMWWPQHLSCSLGLMQQMYGLCTHYKHFWGSSATLCTPETHVNIHPNPPEPPRAFLVHMLSRSLSSPRTCHWLFIFAPLPSKFSHKVPKALPCCFSCLGASTRVPCAASPGAVVDPTSPAASTAPGCFSGAPSSAPLAVKTRELGKSCSSRDLSIPSETALRRSPQKQLVLGPARFCPTSSPPQQVTAPGHGLLTSLCPQRNLG